MSNIEPPDDRVAPVAASALPTWRHRLADPALLFSTIAIVGLVAIWSVTLNRGANERAAADRVTTALAGDLADTYEAQVVRAIREIDYTLKLVRLSLRVTTPEDALETLRERDLLPPELLFTVSITDAHGNLVASTEPSDAAAMPIEPLQSSEEGDALHIGLPRRNEHGDWQIVFSRPIQESDVGITGRVSVSALADYFVSAYDPQVLGESGLLGLIGTDGAFRVSRTGERVTGGVSVDYEALVPKDQSPDTQVLDRVNAWDGVRRYIVARKLFEFPLAIVVGLSVTEQLAPAAVLESIYVMRATGASVLLLLVAMLLGRLNWQLQRARTRAMEERLSHAQRVEYLAYHDNLTELPNRALFTRLLSQGMRHARRYDKSLALLFLDLDRFKAINDSLGHDAGDDLLQEVGRRLLASVRDSDVVARLGGDEFVILLPEISAPSQVTIIAEKILAAVGRPFLLAGSEFRVTVSIGVSVFPADGEDEETLIKNADVAMYHAKDRGKNNFQFYAEELNTSSLERLALESGLRNALEREEFRLFYQAKRDMSTGRITGMEALLRWEHPDLGLVAPMQFIPLAEETGLIIPLGRWVLRTACAQNVAWQKAGLPALSIAVNLSARQFFEEHLLDDVVGALDGSGMSPGLLELEITETMVLQDMARTIAILTGLKKLGVRVAIDDFGTGYSSLSTLKQFPLDTIKIDGSFIRALAHNVEDRGLMTAIIAVGKSLSLTVVAEGVESTEQVAFLRSHACDEFQGFLMDTPMPAEEFAVQLAGGGRGFYPRSLRAVT